LGCLVFSESSEEKGDEIPRKAGSSLAIAGLSLREELEERGEIFQSFFKAHLRN
jgi:hypothetical protein